MKSLLIRLMPAALLCLALTACGGGGAVGQTPYDPETAAQALLDSGACVADQVRDWLERSGRMADPERRGEYRWYVSDSVESFHDLASIFLGREVTEPVEQVAIENY